MTTSTATNSASGYSERAAAFAGIVASVDRWDVPTPCADWTARDVLRHVVETERDFLTRRGLPVAEADLTDPAAGLRGRLRPGGRRAQDRLVGRLGRDPGWGA